MVLVHERTTLCLDALDMAHVLIVVIVSRVDIVFLLEGLTLALNLVLAVIKCIYLPPTYLHFIQDTEDMCLLLISSTSFVDLPFQEHRMTKKHHMNQNPCISSLCPK
jgi:hypothetical protein